MNTLEQGALDAWKAWGEWAKWTVCADCGEWSPCRSRRGRVFLCLDCFSLR